MLRCSPLHTQLHSTTTMNKPPTIFTTSSGRLFLQRTPQNQRQWPTMFPTSGDTQWRRSATAG